MEEIKTLGSKRTTLEYFFYKQISNKEKGTNIVDETGEDTMVVI